MIDDRLAPYGAFVLRITSGALFLAHAALKLFVFTPAGTAKFFESVGLPGPVACLTILAEIAGGIALLVGVYTRWAAIALAGVLLGAIASVHVHNGFFFNAPNGGWEYPAFWMVALLVQALIGDGAFALRRPAGSIARAAAVSA